MGRLHHAGSLQERAGFHCRARTALRQTKIDFSITYDNRLVETALKKYHSPVSQ
ncbi:MAG: hypothetical protein WDN50_05810 [Bradyrhizobium sp.]